jgi:hypothetical protein
MERDFGNFHCIICIEQLSMINKEMLNMNVVVVAVLIKRNLKEVEMQDYVNVCLKYGALSSAVILNSEAH